MSTVSDFFNSLTENWFDAHHRLCTILLIAVLHLNLQTWWIRKVARMRKGEKLWQFWKSDGFFPQLKKRNPADPQMQIPRVRRSVSKVTFVGQDDKTPKD